MAKNANGEARSTKRMRDGKLIRYEGAVTYTGVEFGWSGGLIRSRWAGVVALVAYRMNRSGCARYASVSTAALVADGLGGAVVDVGGSVQAQPAVVMIVVIPGEGLAVPAGGLDGVEAAGEVGPVLQGLELDSLNGLSSDTCGRLCDWVTPSPASRNAAGLEVIEEPRSAWMVG